MRVRFISKAAVLILSGLTLIAGGSAFADDGDHDHGETSDAAEYRHTVMESMGNHIDAIVKIFTGRVDKPDDLVIHARALAETAATIGGLFDPGSEGGYALPLIWDEADQVAAAAEKAATATAALAAAIEGGHRGDIVKAFKEAGGGCKGCHERYKQEDD